MISDLDEIPNPKKIKEFTDSDKLGCFVQKDFLYKLNFYNTTQPKWYGTRICNGFEISKQENYHFINFINLDLISLF